MCDERNFPCRLSATYLSVAFLWQEIDIYTRPNSPHIETLILFHINTDLVGERNRRLADQLGGDGAPLVEAARLGGVPAGARFASGLTPDVLAHAQGNRGAACAVPAALPLRRPSLRSARHLPLRGEEGEPAPTSDPLPAGGGGAATPQGEP